MFYTVGAGHLANFIFCHVGATGDQINAWVVSYPFGISPYLRLITAYSRREVDRSFPPVLDLDFVDRNVRDPYAVCHVIGCRQLAHACRHRGIEGITFLDCSTVWLHQMIVSAELRV